MIERVEHLNDGPLAIERVGDVHTRIVHIHQRFGQESSPISGLPIDQKRISRADRRTDLSQNVRRHHHPAISFVQGLGRQPAFGAPLPPNNVRVLIQRYGRRSRVLITLHTLPRVVPAGFRQREQHRTVAHTERLLGLNEMLLFEMLDDPFDQAELKAQRLRQFAPQHFAPRVQHLQDELLQDRCSEPSVLQRLGRRWNHACALGVLLRRSAEGPGKSFQFAGSSLFNFFRVGCRQDG
jgi:hypothetical protein